MGRRRPQIVGVIAILVLIVVGAGGAILTQAQHTSYRDASAPVSVRVNDLLSRMTLQEKVGQMAQISVSRLWGDCVGGAPGSALNTGCLKQELTTTHVGSVLSGGGEAPSPNTPRAWAEMTNAIQRYAVAKSRLHIPILYGVDAVHGHNNVLGATIFPHNIGMAATWDPGLVQAAAASTARAVRATGIHWTFSPVADLARDLRWGRYYETFGEDPVLASQMIASAVHGYQGTGYSTGVAATVKHFIGYSEPLNGSDRTEAQIPLRYLREMYFPSFQAGITAGTGAVMANSGSVNGVPVHASHYLLTDVLRKQMRFTGITVSDWQDIDALFSRYHVAASQKDAVRMAINAGIDMSMVPYDSRAFTGELASLVSQGKVSKARIDDAVRHILTVKFRLGLFDHPYVDAGKANSAVLGADTGLARRAADESVTLLKNLGNILPLVGSTKSILVAGLGANSVTDQMGGWTLGWQGVPKGQSVPGVTILHALQAQAPPGTSISYASTPDAATAGAKHAGVAVVVVSEKPYAEGFGDTQTALPDASQRKMLDAVLATGTPTVIVVVAGRPLLLTSQFSAARAVLMAFLPGTEGGNGVADVLYGKVDPSGRLPVSWPRDIGQAPIFYTVLPGTNGVSTDLYDPLYPFGYGLSYTSFASSLFRATGPSSRGGTVRAKIRVTNTGTRAGTDIVQVYAHSENSSTLVPPKRLVAFARVTLAPGAAKTVSLLFPASSLAVIPGDITGTSPATVQSGVYTLYAGDLQTEFVVP